MEVVTIDQSARLRHEEDTWTLFSGVRLSASFDLIPQRSSHFTAYTHDFKWNASTTMIAAEKGHLTVLKVNFLEKFPS